MRKTFSLMVGLIALTSISAFAQQAPRAGTPAAAPSGQTPAPAARATTPAPVDPRIDQSDVNIKLTVSVIDKGGATAGTKTVTLMLANMSSGRVRSTGTLPAVGNGRPTVDLNVDAIVELRRSGLVRANLTVYYNPESDDAGKARLSAVNESIVVFLKDGVPLLISQAADPTGSRSLSVEVTANVIK